MTKAKNQTDEENIVPRHCYFWMATLINGKVIPEYDFENEQHNKTRDLPVDFVTRFSWYPVTLTMLQRVKDVFDEDLKLPLNTRIHTIDISIDNGERLRVHPVWRNTLTFLGKGNNSVRYALFKVSPSGETKGFFITELGERLKE